MYRVLYRRERRASRRWIGRLLYWMARRCYLEEQQH